MSVVQTIPLDFRLGRGGAFITVFAVDSLAAVDAFLELERRR